MRSALCRKVVERPLRSLLYENAHGNARDFNRIRKFGFAVPKRHGFNRGRMSPILRISAVEGGLNRSFSAMLSPTAPLFWRTPEFALKDNEWMDAIAPEEEMKPAAKTRIGGLKYQKCYRRDMDVEHVVDRAINFLKEKGGYLFPHLEKVEFDEKTAQWSVWVDVGISEKNVKKVVMDKNGKVIGLE